VAPASVRQHVTADDEFLRVGDLELDPGAATTPEPPTFDLSLFRFFWSKVSKNVVGVRNCTGFAVCFSRL
jgi:hypothetical protein